MRSASLLLARFAATYGVRTSHSLARRASHLIIFLRSTGIFSCFAAVLVSCVQAPTKTYTNYDVDVLFLEKVARAPIEVTNETVIIDSRKHFDFSIAHIPNSVPFNWLEFVDKQSKLPGLLKKDLASEISRLALLGISPEKPIVVVGYGRKGSGEEGRLAWTLLYLGFENVQTADIDSLGLRYSNIETPPKPNAKRWSPEYRHSLLANKKEVIAAATSKFDERVHIIDVRTHAEYFSKNKSLEYELPDLRAVNIEWKNFFTPTGRPNFLIKKELQKVNINPNDRILVICDNGLRAGAVTYALLTMGYKKAANVAGGYLELMDRSR